MPKDKLYLNGFQSWTDSREFSVNEKVPTISGLAKLFNGVFHFSQYGDYSFYKPKFRSKLHSHGYTYIRRRENYEVWKSNDEESGYTIFSLDTKNNQIYAYKDCENVTVNESYHLLDISILKGGKDILSQIFTPSNGKNLSPKLGWTSWYNYYQNISEDIITQNLEAFSKHLPKESIFQIDDGYQTHVGDWLSIDEKKFPNGLTILSEKIHQKNFQSGLWLAPFAAEKNSYLVKNHPNWLLKDANGQFVYGGINWGGFYALNFYHSEVQNYLRSVFDTVLNTWNFDMVKLDFLYAVALLPQNGKSRAKVMLEAMDFLRKIVGDKLILGCGVPISSAFGKVDFCRIGTDISLDWNGKFYQKWIHRERVSTYNSLKNTIYRKHLDQKVFLNDPDVFLLRENNIKLTKNQRITNYLINTIFGSLVFTSDNLSEYKEWQFQLIKNLRFFIKAEVNTVNEENDLFSYTFEINTEKFIGFSNLSSKKLNLKTNFSSELNIFTLKTEENKNLLIQQYETRIFKN